MSKAVVGFMFTTDGKSVVLIRKKRPEWQHGLLNGLGGGVHRGEDSIEAMVREFSEESGVATHPRDWRQYCNLFSRQGVITPNWEVACFCAFSTTYFNEANTVTDEEVIKIDSSDLDGPFRVVQNLKWLIPLALERGDDRPEFTMVTYP